jgi:hypothetical protein
MSTPFVGQLVAELLPAVQLLVIALAGWALRALTVFITQRVKDERVSGALVQASETVWDVVLELEQTLVKELKAATDPDSDGGVKVTATEAAHIKSEALLKAKALLGPAGLKRLAEAMGTTDTAALDAMLSTKIEAAVMQLKLTQGSTIPGALLQTETTP